MVESGILLAILAVIGAYFFGKSQTRKKEDDFHTEVLKERVEELLHLVKQLEVVENLQHESACKEDLLETVHGFFFFEEFANPEAVVASLTERIETLRKYNSPEDMALAAMYQDIVDHNKKYVKK